MKVFVLACVCCVPVALLGTPAEVAAQKKKKDKTEETPPPRREDVPKLIGQLKKGASKDRAMAASQLGRLGQIQLSYVKDAIEPLQKTLQKDSDAGVRKAAAEALGKIAPDPETTVPMLTQALKDEKLEVGLAAAEALGRYGPEASSAVPALREFMKAKVKDKKKDRNIVLIVTSALREIGGKRK